MLKGKPRIAILTSLVDYSPAYSLVGIILDQARAFKRNGYEYDLLCLKTFNHKDYGAPEVDKELSVRYVLPQTRLHDYQPTDKPKNAEKDPKSGVVIPGFEEQVDIHFNGDPEKGWIGYKDVLKDYDVIIDHDLMFLSWHLPQNAAIRRCIEMWPTKNWLHWVHSGPSHPPEGTCYPSTLRYSAEPHGHYVYLNETQRLDYSLMIKSTKNRVSCVYNPKDLRDICGFHPDTCTLIDRYDLFNHQLLLIYPFSTPRWKDKGVRQLCKLIHFWKKQGVKARLVLINAHCNSEVDIPMIEGIEAYAKVCELTLDDDVIMTSRFADESDKKETRKWRYTVPFQTVRDLCIMSNLFVFPSISECCSLIQAEASILGKYMVLNRNFAPMLEFAHPSCLHYEFTTNDPDRNPMYYECVAREIWANIQHDAAIMNSTTARNTVYNRDWIFRNQLELLVYRNFAGDPRERPEPREPARPKLPAPQARELKQARPAAVEIETPDGRTFTAPIEQVIVERERPKQAIKALESPPEQKAGTIEVKATPKPEPATPKPRLEPATPYPDPDYSREPDFNNPRPGMVCPVFGKCTEEQMQDCFNEAGHCLVLDDEFKDEEEAA